MKIDNNIDENDIWVKSMKRYDSVTSIGSFSFDNCESLKIWSFS